MGLLSLLKKKSPNFYIALALLGLSDAVLNIGLLLFINLTIGGAKMPALTGNRPVLIYGGVLLVSIVCSNLFQRYIIRLTNDLRFEMELKILEKLEQSSYEKFERLGNEKVFTAMGDAQELAYLPEVFMSSFNALVIVLCCLAYLFVTSWMGGVIVLVIMAVLLVVYMVRNQAAEKDLNLLRDLQDKHFVYLSDLLHGYKEIKISRVRTTSIFNDFFYPNRREGKQLAVRSAIRYMSNELTGKYSWYIVLGVIMFFLPSLFHLKSQDLLAFVTTILYLIGPVAVLITLVPTYTRVKIAISRLYRYEQQIQVKLEAHAAAEEVAEALLPVACIKFEGVKFDYTDAGNGNQFSLGPLQLDINKGELIFITGGNGSGKSTFVNLLTGLYQPDKGRVCLESDNGRLIPGGTAYYREHFSVIFTNPHLFKENYNRFDLQENDGFFRESVNKMRLDDIIRVDPEKKVIDKNLSKGQQKRVAMIYALMERKPVIVLDEWAAEQDPEFRAYFYKNFLPELKRKGKTIIAITHDDAYFHYADRIIRFDYGKVSSITKKETLLTARDQT